MLVAELLAGQRQLPDVLEAVRRGLLHVLVLGADQPQQVRHHAGLMHRHAVPRVLGMSSIAKVESARRGPLLGPSISNFTFKNLCLNMRLNMLGRHEIWTLVRKDHNRRASFKSQVGFR